MFNTKILIAGFAALISIGGVIAFQSTRQADLAEQSVGLQQAADIEAQIKEQALINERKKNKETEKNLVNLVTGGR